MKPVFTRQVYWSGQEAIDLVNEAEKIQKREKWSFNQITRIALSEFVRRHKEGNTSFQLDTFGVTWNKAEKAGQRKPCHVTGCPNLGIHKMSHPKRQGSIWACRNHWRDMMGQGWRKEKA
jgi:hypothetical protein